MILGVTAVLTLRKILLSICEHTSYVQIHSVGTCLYLEGHDVFQLSTVTGVVQGMVAPPELQHVVLKIQTLLESLPYNVAVRLSQHPAEFALSVSDANSDMETIVLPVVDFITYNRCPYLAPLDKYVSILLYTSDFISITNTLCLGNGVCTIRLDGTCLVFETTNEYGTITVEKTTNLDVHVLHANLAVKHFRCMTHLQGFDTLNLQIARQACTHNVIGISTIDASFTMWLHTVQLP